VHAGDGLQLIGTRLVAAVRCAPPQNQPTPAARDTCAPWIERELGLVLPSVRAVVCLGGVGWEAALRALASAGVTVPRPRPKFGHAVEVELVGPGQGRLTLLGCYHPSQQNTFTGKLTEPMLDAVLGRAAALGDLPP
jgi:uracil-DNA glycosylase